MKEIAKEDVFFIDVFVLFSSAGFFLSFGRFSPNFLGYSGTMVIVLSAETNSMGQLVSSEFLENCATFCAPRHYHGLPYGIYRVFRLQFDIIVRIAAEIQVCKHLNLFLFPV